MSAGAVNNAENILDEESQRDESEQKASAAAPPATLHPPTLLKDGGPVTGALKHHLKKQNKREKK